MATTYPTAIDTGVSLYDPDDLLFTRLTAPMSSGDTTATVNSTTGFQASGPLRISTTGDTNIEFVTYSSKDATHFYGITRAINPRFPAVSHAVGELSSDEFQALHYDTLRGAIIAIEGTLGVNPQGSFATVAARLAAGGGGGGGGGSSAAKYIVQQPDGTLPNAQALSALATGILKSTTSTGIASIALAGTDYLSPAGVETVQNKNIRNPNNQVSASYLFSATTEIDIVSATAPTTGQVLTATGPTTATWQAAAGGGGMAWNILAISTLSQAMSPGQGYVPTATAPVTLSLPTTCAAGQIVAVKGSGSGGWVISQGAGQSIVFRNGVATTAGVLGHLDSTDRYDSVELICIAANTTFTPLNGWGNPTAT